MAEIELAALSDRLDDEELEKLAKRLDEAGVEFDVTADAASVRLGARLDEDAVTEFLDRLEAHEVGAEIFIPVEFDGVFTVGDYRVASTQALAPALEELRDELDVDEDEEDEEDENEEDDDDDYDDDRLIEAQLRLIWRVMNEACEESLERGVPIQISI
jgi:hypothetical protein